METLTFDQLLDNFHFLRPLWLLALLPALLFVLALWQVNHRLNAWEKAIDQTLLPWLLERRHHVARRTSLLLLLLGWLLTVIALAGPVWQQLPQPVQQREDALVIVMDLSLSMFAADHSPSRLDLAKRKLRDILALRQEGQTALVVYAGDAHTVTPLTDDVVTIAALVPSLNPNIMPLFGSNPEAALTLAIKLLDDAQTSRGRILLMTDGIQGFSEEQRLVERMATTDYQLLVMGIGTEDGAPIRTSDGSLLTDRNGTPVVPTLNRPVLQSLANRSGGRYHDIQLADPDIAFLLADTALLDDSALRMVEEEFDVWHETGPWLLLLILPLAALGFRRGWLFTLVWLIAGPGVLLPAPQARALDWRDWWQTPDQQGAAAFAEEDHALAASLFEQPDWAGTANYRAENYEAAIAAFSGSDTPDGHYNRGNALAQQGNYQEAMAAYDAAIALDSEHEDAIHNKAIVEQLLEQQQQSADGEQQQGEDQQQQQTEQNARNQSEDEQNSEQQQQSQQGNEEEEPQQQQQNPAPQEQQGSESDSEQNTPSESRNEDFEQQQSLEQWLRRIEDDPGELLRRKFRYQYRQRQLNGTVDNIPNGGQIW